MESADPVFWTENPLKLIYDDCEEGSFEQFMNSVSRAVILVWVVLLVTRNKYASQFLMGGLFLSIFFYYVKVNNMSEYFSEPYSSREPYSSVPNSIPLSEWRSLPSPDNLKLASPNQYTLCKTQRPISMDSNYKSANQALATGNYSPANASMMGHTSASAPVYAQVYAQNKGQCNKKAKSLPGNPKLQRPPLIPAPMFDNTYWSQPFIPPSGINAATHTELYQSGYLSSSQCGKTCIPVPLPNIPEQNPYENQYMSTMDANRADTRPPPAPVAYTTPAPYPTSTVRREGYVDVERLEKEGKRLPNSVLSREHATERSRFPPTVSGCTYQPSQLQHNLPTNATVGPCQLSDSFDEYNKNMYTTPMEPGRYMRAEILETPVTNIGITTTPQLRPIRCERDSRGNSVTVIQDPEHAVIEPIREFPVTARPDNVYDPRSYGYGDGNRAYIDDMTGQLRYMYDDIDSIRAPNYIGRSNIDLFNWSQSYGPISAKADSSLDYSRALAEKQFMESTLNTRANLQTSWMRKVNTEVVPRKRSMPAFMSGRAMN